MAGTTTSTLAAAIPSIVSDAVKRTYDVPVLTTACKIKYMSQGQGKTVKFPTLPYSSTDFAAASGESTPFGTTAYTPGSGTATITDNGYVLEVSDFALDSSALTIEEIIGELQLAAEESRELQVADEFNAFTAIAPVTGSVTVAKVIEGDVKLSAFVGNSVNLVGGAEGGRCLALSNGQYSYLRGQILDSKGLNGVGTNPVTKAWNDGQMFDLMGIQLLPSRQIHLSTATTADDVGLMFVKGMAIGCAVQRLPYVTWERRAMLPSGGIAGWIISVSYRQGVKMIRNNHGVQFQNA